MSRDNFATSTALQRELYSDFSIDFTPHPNSGDLTRQVNELAIKRSLRNIIMTDKNERPFQPTLGSNIRKSLFDNVSSATSQNLKQNILDAISTHEQRVRVSNVEVIHDDLRQAYRINIFFFIVNSVTQSALTLTLYRVR
jgi:phage baseplate assembly protein W